MNNGAVNTAGSFFLRQEAARRSTSVLLVYFLLAVLTVLLLVNIVVGLVMMGLLHRLPGWGWPQLLWNPWSLRALSGPLFLIGLGTLIGFFQMRTGGHAVARMVLATPVDYGVTNDPLRRRLINVVEEMAIAAGLRLPALYVMEHEDGINAFVAGYASSDTVLVVTIGALRQLNRDELQGVVGHEFSHILNGDMHINIRLIAVLTGLLIMSQTGAALLRMGTGSAASQNFLLGMGCLVLGLLVWPLGLVGLVLGRLIKAALSRQRETLADASSVQFTRHPEALCQALLKIQQQYGSRLSGPYAEAMSHMCFGPALDMARLYATHPPLEERIEAILPGFLERVAWSPVGTTPGRVDEIERPYMSLGEGGEGRVGRLEPARLGASVGTVRPQDVLAASEFRQKLPPAIARALDSTEGCRALLYALVVEQQAYAHVAQQAFFQDREAPGMADAVAQLVGALAGSRVVRLPLVDLALPRLDLLSRGGVGLLLANLHAFTLLDRRLSVFEFALLTLLRQQLLMPRPLAARHPLAALAEPAALVVAVLVRHGDLLPEHVQKAYEQALAPVFTPLPPMPPPQAQSLPKMALALRSLSGLTPAGKQQFLELCAAVVQYDGQLSRKEYELLRVVAALLECPLPLALILPETLPAKGFT